MLAGSTFGADRGANRAPNNTQAQKTELKGLKSEAQTLAGSLPASKGDGVSWEWVRIRVALAWGVRLTPTFLVGCEGSSYERSSFLPARLGILTSPGLALDDLRLPDR